jgi:hypothetical protein
LDVMFFRGLVLAAATFLVLFALGLLATRVRPSYGFMGRDAFSAAVLSLSFNVCFLVVVPVTVDRSISVFMLGEMANAPDHLFSSAEMSRIFTKVYVGDLAQIDRRMHEQSVTGNVEQLQDGYRITPRGRRFIAAAKVTSRLFGGDPRFASPPPP